MELLLELTEKNIGAEAVESFAFPYQLRKASRAVIFNQTNEVAIMAVTKLNYHKLPGGGVEEEETLHSALKREALEEAGSQIEIGKELGAIIEYRNQSKRLQISYCYLVKLVGKPKDPELTQEETDKGFQLLWLPLDEAIVQLEKDTPDDYEGKFIRLRDLEFLRQAAKVRS